MHPIGYIPSTFSRIQHSQQSRGSSGRLEPMDELDEQMRCSLNKAGRGQPLFFFPEHLMPKNLPNTFMIDDMHMYYTVYIHIHIHIHTLHYIRFHDIR